MPRHIFIKNLTYSGLTALGCALVISIRYAHAYLVQYGDDNIKEMLPHINEAQSEVVKAELNKNTTKPVKEVLPIIVKAQECLEITRSISQLNDYFSVCFKSEDVLNIYDWSPDSRQDIHGKLIDAYREISSIQEECLREVSMNTLLEDILSPRSESLECSEPERSHEE